MDSLNVLIQSFLGWNVYRIEILIKNTSDLLRACTDDHEGIGVVLESVMKIVNALIQIRLRSHMSRKHCQI